jgi:hypothetical protein
MNRDSIRIGPHPTRDGSSVNEVVYTLSVQGANR